MTDVRLTAINPEDSQVYPVACNSSGELLVNNVETDEFVKVTGDNMTGDLTLGTDKITLDATDGNASFASTVEAEANYYNGDGGWDTFTLFKGVQKDNVSGNSNEVYKVDGNGSASFAGEVTQKGSTISPTDKSGGLYVLDPDGNTAAATVLGDGSASFAGAVGVTRASGGQTAFASFLSGSTNSTFKVTANGSASFADGKAGFTADGYLWCTTRRGDTVILDATSNGLATWADYTPPTRREQLEEKVQEIREDRK